MFPEEAASAAATGAVAAARDIGEAAFSSVKHAVAGTISGIRVILKVPFKD